MMVVPGKISYLIQHDVMVNSQHDPSHCLLAFNRMCAIPSIERRALRSGHCQKGTTMVAAPATKAANERLCALNIGEQKAAVGRLSFRKQPRLLALASHAGVGRFVL
jgi:hypothetical protein